MKWKTVSGIGLAAALSFSLAACGNSEDTASGESSDKKEQQITYLDKEYTLPKETDTIVAASLESMEDAAALGVKPAGALSVGGETPAYLEEDLSGVELIGEKMQPNYETILSLEPDVILGSSKFPEDVSKSLNDIAATIPYSHISENWEANLELLGFLTGKEDEAEQIISDYELDSEEAKTELGEKLEDKQVLVVRIRAGSLYVYPQNVYLNPVLYGDLGLQVPDVINEAEAQAEISLEKLAEVNPDYLFLQFETTENPENASALEDLQNNDIFKSTNAAKEDHVFVNAIDPLAQGGTAWSKTEFLKAATEKLAE
ncbi:iron-hydroxamate ABC transporter substrate-binding protein [Terribacillus saccharophilus]|uniref:iron-hydroxamate ABC transporter substrate-binding protein n=1 Tax=Terribacillus saccharophilus TaxID=361277 RepID=UPI002989CF5D|nr:iron-hydroxamate ABC transporter substrate-binding protein [Terribacillus saccharophilus]MCM3226986.1 iron-hydroxamate ABC transporter substrate-binding protein [Terribacillus saccharophilus]